MPTISKRTANILGYLAMTGFWALFFGIIFYGASR